ncbi:hypothetical protein OT109_03795 [Phycisphaeraceae bacterium D3-23]
MSISSKTAVSQIPKLMVYRKPLHPELFSFHGRRVDRQGDYEIESWVVQRGHLVRFIVDGQSMTEAVLEGGENLPEAGLAHALPCVGEKEYDHGIEGRIRYMSTLQTEVLPESLYLATYREMVEFASDTNALSKDEDTPAGPNLVVLDCQKYKREFHFQGYHLTAHNSTVLRTQSVFEVVQ